MKKRASFGIAVLATVALVGVALPASADTSGQSPLTVASFRDQLSAEASASTEAAVELNKFNALPATQQQALVDYLADPEVARSIEYALESGEPTSLKNGDIQIVATAPAPESIPDIIIVPGGGPGVPMITAVEYNVTSKWSISSKIFGVEITKFTQTFKYVTGNGVVKRVQACWGAAVNFNFVIQLSNQASFYKLAGGRAECDVLWTGYAGFKDFGIRIDKLQKMIVNGPGIVSASLRNY